MLHDPCVLAPMLLLLLAGIEWFSLAGRFGCGAPVKPVRRLFRAPKPFSSTARRWSPSPAVAARSSSRASFGFWRRLDALVARGKTTGKTFARVAVDHQDGPSSAGEADAHKRAPARELAPADVPTPRTRRSRAAITTAPAWRGASGRGSRAGVGQPCLNIQRAPPRACSCTASPKARTSEVRSAARGPASTPVTSSSSSSKVEAAHRTTSTLGCASTKR